MTIKSQIETIAAFEYLKNIPSDQVYSYLKSNAENEYIDESGKDYLGIEALLSTLNNPLINLGLAQYGYNDDVVQMMYENGNKAVKLAALMNRRDNFHVTDISNRSWVDKNIFKKIIISSNEDEKYALLTNPLLGANILTDLFEKKEPFESVSESDWQNLLKYSGDNILLKKPYDGHYADGYTDFLYSQMFYSAWKLADIVPVTNEWAKTLWRLLYNTVPHYDIDPFVTIQRWKSLNEKSVDVRMILAKALHGDNFLKLKDSDDLEMRMSYYEKFHCSDEKALEVFFNRDKKYFLESAIWNDNLYRDDVIRDKLGELTLKTEDSDLMYYNFYISREKNNKKDHPEWFEEKIKNDEFENKNDSESSSILLAQLFKKLSDIHSLVYLNFIIVLGVAVYLWFKFR